MITMSPEISVRNLPSLTQLAVGSAHVATHDRACAGARPRPSRQGRRVRRGHQQRDRRRRCAATLPPTTSTPTLTLCTAQPPFVCRVVAVTELNEEVACRPTPTPILCHADQLRDHRPPCAEFRAPHAGSNRRHVRRLAGEVLQVERVALLPCGIHMGEALCAARRVARRQGYAARQRRFRRHHRLRLADQVPWEVKTPPLAVASSGSCASVGRTWRL